MSNSSTAATEEAAKVATLMEQRNVPLEYQVDMGGHTKAVSCISAEPAGNRLITGSLDYFIKIYDFGGMDSRLKAFRSIEVEDGYPVVSISHSATGDKFIVGTSSCQPKVYDRDGKEIITFARGDMYIRDLTHTKGHIMEVTGVAWHPSSKTTVLSSSLDGTVRVWDLEGEAAFGKLTSKHVLKLKGKTAARIGATCCCYSPDGSRMAAGGADGSVQVWLNKKAPNSRPDLTMKATSVGIGHCDNATITSVVFSPDSSILASRGNDGTVVLWSIKPFSASSELKGSHQTTPLKTISDTINMYPQANVEFSPDGNMICCGTSAAKVTTKKAEGVAGESTSSSSSSSSSSANSSSVAKEEDSKCYLLFYDVKGSVVEPVMRISVLGAGSLIHVKWAANTNQLFCSTANGFTRVFYDPRFSKKGVLLAATKAPKREKDPTDYAIVGEIINPNALPLYRAENSLKKRAVERRAEAKAHVPARELSTGPMKAPNNSFFFTQFVMQDKVKDSKRSEDPREALLKYNTMATSDPMFLGRAYEQTQPKTVMAQMTYEEEEEAFRKKQKL